jgi:acid stress chaperone HdeA
MSSNRSQQSTTEGALVIPSISKKLAMAAGMAAAISLAGCSSVINQGGDTTCKEYLTQDEATQNEAVIKMLKDENQQDPSGLQSTAARNSALAYCKTLGNENSKIKEAPHL